MNIFVEENIPLLAQSLKPCGDVITFSGRNLRNEDLRKGDCQMLFVRSTTKVNEELLKGTNVEFVGTATSGIDHIDTDYLKSKFISFVYAPGSNANSVAEYVVFSILKWGEQNNKDLSKVTIGIIGYGNIGKLVAKYTNYMGLNILVNDPPLKDSGYGFPSFAHYCELDEMFNSSEIITNHVPLTLSGEYPSSGLINARHISCLKDSSLFIHTSRGGVVDEEALTGNIKKKKLFLSIDVWENEPFINSILAQEAIIATPHVAGYSYDGKLRGTMSMLNGFRKFFNIEPDTGAITGESSGYCPLTANQYLKYKELYSLLSNSRNIDNDTRKLTESLKLSDELRKQAFDNLRKNYPNRREIL